MAGLLYLEPTYNLSDEATCERWLENCYWHYFTGEVYFQTRLPCDPSSFTRWRNRLGEAGLEELLAKTIEAAKTTSPRMMLERAEQLRIPYRKAKNKPYALHASEVECISKGKSRQSYELDVKAGIAITARGGLIVGARSFPGNPYDGGTLAEQPEQAEILSGEKPFTAIVDLGYRGRSLEGVEILRRGKPKLLTRRQWSWVKRRQAVEPVIGYLKDDCRLRRNRLIGVPGDALRVLSGAAGYNLRRLLRWVVFF